jgi:uncharacterized protein
VASRYAADVRTAYVDEVHSLYGDGVLTIVEEALNPFVFETPLERVEQLVGRDAELTELDGLARAGTYTLIEAPRRYGKTSLLKAYVRRWQEDEKALGIVVDFSRVLTIEEAARRIRVAYEAETRGGVGQVVRELLSSIRVHFGPVELGPVAPAALDQAAGLHELLELPVKIAERTGRRSFVAFDEFHDVLAVPDLDGLLRSHIQHHRERVTYVFAGSEPSLLRELFGDRARPLYGQAHPLTLGRIDLRLLIEDVAAKFQATGKTAGEGGIDVVQLGQGHPQRTMLLAWNLWEQTAPGANARREDALGAQAAALRTRRAELDALWRALNQSERRVTLAIAHSLPPTGSRAARATGLKSRSAAQTALRTLLEHGEVERRPEGMLLADPLLAAYLRHEHPLPSAEGGRDARRH